MKETIQAFLDDKKVAIVGASPNKDNFGRSLMTELSKRSTIPIPVNPKYEEVEGSHMCPNGERLAQRGNKCDPGSTFLALPRRLSISASAPILNGFG